MVEIQALRHGFAAGMLIAYFSGWVTLAAGPGVQDAGGAPAACYSADQLRGRISAAQALITSFKVELFSNGYNDEMRRDAAAYVYRIIAAKPPASLLHVSAHGFRDMSWKIDPESQRAIIAGGKALNIFDVNRAYVEKPCLDDDPLPGTLPAELFFHATGIFPLTKRPAPRALIDGTGPSMLRDVAASRSYDHVRPEQELADGRWCHVLEFRGHDVLWLDPERGCAVLAREVYDPRTGALAWRVECSGHRQVADGVWLPARFRNIRFDYLAPTPELRSRRLTDAPVDVVRAEANSVSDDDFRYDPPPGALRLNGPGDLPVQVAPGGETHLDDLVQWSKQVLKERWSRTSTPGGWRFLPQIIWTSVGVTLCLAVLAILAIQHRSGFRSRPSSRGVTGDAR